MDSFTNNILLSNLTRIRWLAIIGQFIAIIFVFYYLNIKIPIFSIWGSLRNKNPKKLIKNFKGIFKKIITVKIPNEPSAMSSNKLYKIAKENGFQTVESKNIKDALKKIPKKDKKIIVIFGSLYLVGKVLSMN